MSKSVSAATMSTELLSSHITQRDVIIYQRSKTKLLPPYSHKSFISYAIIHTSE